MEIKTKKDGSFNQTLKFFLSRLHNISADEKIFFTKNLSVMMKAGLALSSALKILSQQTKNKRFKVVLENIQNKIEAGASLSESLNKYPDVFSEIFTNMVEAGEKSGQLEKSLDEVTAQMKKSREFSSKLKRALTYPVVIIFVMIGIGVFALTFVIPKMMTVFSEVDVALPLPTRILIGISSFIVNQWYIVVSILIIILIFVWKTGKTVKGRHFFDSLLLKLPIAGPLLKKINLIKFSRTFSSLLASGIPLVQTLEITSRVLDNVLYKDVLFKVSKETTRGINISMILKNSPDLFPLIITQMVEVGEKTGTLETILQDIIDFYEDDVDETLTNFTSIIEPVLIVLIGIAVAIMALAIIMPMYSLVNAI